jgi:hypothetical protein
MWGPGMFGWNMTSISITPDPLSKGWVHQTIFNGAQEVERG